MDDCYTFREELAVTYPVHGHALWEPDPGGLYDTVTVGDVGFIREGCFYSLFNALRPPSDPETQHGSKYPPQLQPKKSPHIRSSRDNQRYFCSKNVTKVPWESNIYATGPDDEPSITFSCSGKQGALLYLPFLAERQDTLARGDFGEWLLQNIDTCFKVAVDLGCGVDRMEDIILVTGCHLARSWVNVAFSENQGGAQASFGVRVSGNSSVHFDERNASGRGLKLGPSGENLPKNQCIFIRGYRVFRFLNIWPKLRAAGLAPDMGGPEPESERPHELISIPSDPEYQDPLHVLSAHIAEQAPDCDMILVHDDDLDAVLESPLLEEPMRHTQNRAWAIRQVRCEVLPGENTGSGTEVSTTTVATLSKDVFEGPHEDQYGLEYSRPVSVTSGRTNAISQSKSSENTDLGHGGLPRPLFSQSDDFLSNVADVPAFSVSSHKRLPNLDSPHPSISFTGPTQSGSQTYLLSSPFAELTDQYTLTSPATFSVILAHPISEFELPLTLERSVGQELEQLEQDSSDENSCPLVVVENSRFKTATANMNNTCLILTRLLSSYGSNGNATCNSTDRCAGLFSILFPHLSVLLTAQRNELQGSGGLIHDIVRLPLAEETPAVEISPYDVPLLISI